MVYEEIVEGITRFFAVFHSATSDPVGPIRSARTTDVDLLAQLNHPLFAWSGGNKGVVKALKQASVATDLGASTGNNARAGGYYRDASRRAPHNFYSTTSNLWALTPDGASPPPPLFTYRAAGAAPAGATPVAGAKLSMAATRVQWLWDAAAGGWRRAQDGTPHVDANGSVITPQNVVIMFVPYTKSAADPISPEAVTVGQGEAWVLTDGRCRQGHMDSARTRPSRPCCSDAAGNEIALTPGRTWVELARSGGAALIPEGTDPAAVAYPSRAMNDTPSPSQGPCCRCTSGPRPSSGSTPWTSVAVCARRATTTRRGHCRASSCRRAWTAGRCSTSAPGTASTPSRWSAAARRRCSPPTTSAGAATGGRRRTASTSLGRPSGRTWRT